MKNFIKRVLKKALSFVEKGESLNQNKFLAKPETTKLLPGTQVKYSTNNDERIYVTIGEKCIIGGTFLFETNKGEINIGNNVHIGGAFFICRSSIIIHDDVTMAWGITIYDHNSHSIYWEDRKNDNHNCYSDYINYNGNNVVNKDWSNVVSKPIIIQSKVWIGFGVTILKGVTIGEGAVVGACSVVTKDVEPWTVVGGNPAILLKKLQ